MSEIVIENYVFSHMGKESNERTIKRLQQIIDIGMTECGQAQFGIRDVVSGLYIEKIWSYNEEEWKDYLEWVQNLIDNK